MNKKKTIIAALVLLLLLAIGGVMAYFTDSDAEENVFTIGKVDIELSEPTWVSTGAAKAESMMPGDVIEKDPTVTVAADSEDAWVFVKVEVPCLGETELFTYSVNSGWTAIRETACTDGKAVKVYGHTDSMTKNATATLFSTVTFANLTDAQFAELTDADATTTAKDLKMPVKAFAVQKDNVAGATAEVFAANFPGE
ncbi:MAG: SipW-dependent-type signal peptide-containing protein [Bacilli bacterium]|nr:SipW-dependent-type signal peptide-containing protein [Bacilli bacterium]